MPRTKSMNIFAHLNIGERAHVLDQLLKSHPELHEEAREIATNLINDISTEAVAEEVVALVSSIDLGQLNSRAGRHSWGYVEPSEAAWELLEEAIKDIQASMTRRFEVGMKQAAEEVCQGIILGLHEVESTIDDGVLRWAPDFAAEAAGWSMSLLLQLYPQRQRRAAGNRIIRAITEQIEDWNEMLNRVIDSSASAQPRGKK